MANGDPVQGILKILLGEVPARGAVKLMAVGAAAAMVWFGIRDFKKELGDYIKSNQVWQEATIEERARLIKKANARLRRLYEANGWVYEDMEP